jgi:hypothetical protein
MSGPQVTPEQAQEAARQLLAEQAQTVTGADSAGIYGDPAGASQPSGQVMDMSAAVPATTDVEALMERIRALEAAQPPPPPEPEEPDHTLRVDSGAPGWLHALAAEVEARLTAIEHKIGLAIEHKIGL